LNGSASEVDGIAKATWTAIVVSVFLVVGCVGPEGTLTQQSGGPAPIGSSEPTISPAAMVWPGGIELPSGNRYAISDSETGWILSRPTSDDPRLYLTKLSLTDGDLTTNATDLDDLPSPIVGGVAEDGSGHVWLAFGPQLEEISETGSPTRTWQLPPTAADAARSDEDPTAGYVYSDAFDAANDLLYFAREGDHRLDSLDPATGTFQTVADLGITISDQSRLALGVNGTVSINGNKLDAKVFEPVAAVLGPGAMSPTIDPGVLATCGSPLGTLELAVSGNVGLTSTSKSLAQVPFPIHSGTPFACDSMGNGFGFGIVGAPATPDAVIIRIDPTGSKSTVDLPVIPTTSTPAVPGAATFTSFASPVVEALLPDGSGGVWLATAFGTTVGQDTIGGQGTIAYPSLWHATFTP
jgi:hypothetical protein